MTHTQKNTRAYWALKRFLNNKEVPLILLIFHENEYKKEAELFNSFFAKQCSLISNSSELPPNLHFTTEKPLDTLNSSNNDIEKDYAKLRSKQS